MVVKSLQVAQIPYLLKRKIQVLEQDVHTLKGIPPGGGIFSNAPSGKCKVTNIYVNPATGKLIIEYDNTPV